MAAPGSHHWVREYFFRIRGSREFVELKDHQYGWLCRLRTHAQCNEGYLPTDVNGLWTLAGAKTRTFFEKDAAMVLSYFDGRTVDGQRMFNTFDLRELKEARKKLRVTGMEDDDASLSLPGIGYSVTSTQDLGVSVEKLFAFYCEIFARDPRRYSLTADRRHKAELRLFERVKANRGDLPRAEQDCRDAIANLRLSKFHMEHDHIDWEQIFRSEGRLQEFLDKPTGGEAALHPKHQPYSVAIVEPCPVSAQAIDAANDPWRKVLAIVELSVNRHSFDTWLKPTRFHALEDDALYVRVPTAEFRGVGEKYGHLIKAALAKLGLELAVKYVTADEVAARAKEAV